MKIPTAETEHFVREPDPEWIAVLVYGPDQGLVRERARKIASSVVEDLADPRKVDHDRDGMHPPERWNSLDELAHRNKQSLAVNLAEPAGREILAKLVAKADVFLTDLPFATLDERGWSYESLCELKADLVLAR